MSGQLPRSGVCGGGCAGGGGGGGDGGEGNIHPKAIDATDVEAIGEAHAATDDCQAYGASYQETNDPVAACPSTAEANNGFGTRADQ